MKTKKINKETAEARRLAAKYRNLYVRFKAKDVTADGDYSFADIEDEEKAIRTMEKLPWENR